MGLSALIVVTAFGAVVAAVIVSDYRANRRRERDQDRRDLARIAHAPARQLPASSRLVRVLRDDADTVCATCREAIYIDAGEWIHSDTGDLFCYPDDGGAWADAIAEPVAGIDPADLFREDA